MPLAAELDHPPADLAHVRVLLDVGGAEIGQPKPADRGVGQEQVRAIPDLRLDGVLQEAVRDVDRGADGAPSSRRPSGALPGPDAARS